MFVKALGADIYVEQHGAGDAEILLLHGWGCQAELWRPVTEALSKRARVTVLDFAGHGKSGRPPVPWGAEEYCEMVAETMDALELSKCHVIGHSHGGRIGLLLAATHAERVQKLVVTSAAGLRADPSGEKQKKASQYKRLRKVADCFEKAKIFGTIPDRMREALIQRYGSPDYRALDAEMRKTFVKVVNFDIGPALPEIKAPTLLIWGDQDTETPLWMGQRMEALIPDAGLVVLAGGTHYAYLEKVSDFLRIVSYFLFGGGE